MEEYNNGKVLIRREKYFFKHRDKVNRVTTFFSFRNLDDRLQGAENKIYDPIIGLSLNIKRKFGDIHAYSCVCIRKYKYNIHILYHACTHTYIYIYVYVCKKQLLFNGGSQRAVS